MLTFAGGCRTCQSTQQNTRAGSRCTILLLCGCLIHRSCSNSMASLCSKMHSFLLHCGKCPSGARASTLKCLQSLCLEFKLFEGVVIRMRLIFGYSTFWLQPHTLLRHDAAGLRPSLPLRWSFSQLRLLHLLLFVHQAVSASLPLWLTDLDLTLGLSKCRQGIWLRHVSGTLLRQLALHVHRLPVLVKMRSSHLGSTEGVLELRDKLLSAVLTSGS